MFQFLCFCPGIHLLCDMVAGYVEVFMFCDISFLFLAVCVSFYVYCGAVLSSRIRHLVPDVVVHFVPAFSVVLADFIVPMDNCGVV